METRREEERGGVQRNALFLLTRHRSSSQWPTRQFSARRSPRRIELSVILHSRASQADKLLRSCRVHTSVSTGCWCAKRGTFLIYLQLCDTKSKTIYATDIFTIRKTLVINALKCDTMSSRWYKSTETLMSAPLRRSHILTCLHLLYSGAYIKHQIHSEYFFRFYLELRITP